MKVTLSGRETRLAAVLIELVGKIKIDQSVGALTECATIINLNS